MGHVEDTDDGLNSDAQESQDHHQSDEHPTIEDSDPQEELFFEHTDAEDISRSKKHIEDSASKEEMCSEHTDAGDIYESEEHIEDSDSQEELYFTSRPFLKTAGGIVLGSVAVSAVSAVSADVLPYISVAIKASFLKLGMCNICKNNIAKMFLDFFKILNCSFDRGF